VKVLAVMDGLGAGGSETSMLAMAPLFAQLGVDLEVAYFHGRTASPDAFAAAGVPLLHVAPGRTRLETIWRLRDLVRARSPDLVHTTMFEADIAGRSAATLAGAPVVSSIINEMYGPAQRARVPHAWKMRAAQAADVVTARRVVRFHAVTHTLATIMRPRLHLGSRPIDVIYRGRSPEKFARPDPVARGAKRSALGFSESDALVLAVARHESQKDLATLVRAMHVVAAAIPNVHLLMAGREGADTPRLRALTRELGLEGLVQFLGVRADVDELLGAADVFVFPSRWEGIGGAVVEALAVECPIVCSDLPVLREIATDDRGQELALMCEPGNAAEFAGAIATVLGGGPTIARRQRAGRRRFEQCFTIDHIAAQMVAFYSRSVENSRHESE